MQEFDLIAVLEGKHPFAPLPALQMIVQDDLTAVLSAKPRPSLRPPQSLAQHLAEVALHLEWQTACMALAPLLPVRLDTPLTRAGASRFLIANQPFLDQLLSRYAGMAQVQVTVGWQEAAVSSRFGHEGEFAALSAQGVPAAMDVAQAVHHLALRMAGMIGAQIATIATEIAPLPITPGLVWSGVVLLPLRKLTELAHVLGRLRGIWPEGLKITQIGPDPVTSFATLDLSPVSARQIDQALMSFGLRSRADLGQLAAARRRKLVDARYQADAGLRSEISDQAELLAATARLAHSHEGFALCRIWSEGRGSLPAAPRAVA